MKLWQMLRGKGAWIDGVWLNDEQQMILAAVFQGAALRSHRDLEGNKVYLLHFGEGEEKREIGRKATLDLRTKRLIETNHKFPSATFLLTTRGNTIGAKLANGKGSNPTSARDFVQ